MAWHGFGTIWNQGTSWPSPPPSRLPPACTRQNIAHSLIAHSLLSLWPPGLWCRTTPRPTQPLRSLVCSLFSLHPMPRRRLITGAADTRIFHPSEHGTCSTTPAASEPSRVRDAAPLASSGVRGIRKDTTTRSRPLSLRLPSVRRPWRVPIQDIAVSRSTVEWLRRWIAQWAHCTSPVLLQEQPRAAGEPASLGAAYCLSATPPFLYETTPPDTLTRRAAVGCERHDGLRAKGAADAALLADRIQVTAQVRPPVHQHSNVIYQPDVDALERRECRWECERLSVSPRPAAVPSEPPVS